MSIVGHVRLLILGGIDVLLSMPLLIVAICVSVAIIWCSAKAKPIGSAPHQKPYRWGTFVALITGMLSLSLFTQMIWVVKGDLFQPQVNIFQVIPIAGLALLGATTWGLLLFRQKPAVLSCFVTYGMMFVTAMSVIVAAGRRMNGQEMRRDGPLLIFFVFSGSYLWKRRHLFRRSVW